MASPESASFLRGCIGAVVFPAILCFAVSQNKTYVVDRKTVRGVRTVYVAPKRDSDDYGFSNVLTEFWIPYGAAAIFGYSICSRVRS